VATENSLMGSHSSHLSTHFFMIPERCWDVSVFNWGGGVFHTVKWPVKACSGERSFLFVFLCVISLFLTAKFAFITCAVVGRKLAIVYLSLTKQIVSLPQWWERKCFNISLFCSLPFARSNLYRTVTVRVQKKNSTQMATDSNRMLVFSSSKCPSQEYLVWTHCVLPFFLHRHIITSFTYITMCSIVEHDIYRCGMFCTPSNSTIRHLVT